MYSTEDKTKVIMRLKNLRSENKVSCDHAVKRKMYILKQGVAIIEIERKYGL
jgi:glutamate synthase domain-containing protein 2